MANWANVDRLGNPADPNWQRDNLTWIEPVPGQRWQVYKPAAEAFNGLLGDLIAQGYKPTSSGGFNYRNIRGGNKLSQHAFGTAIDINAGTNPMLGRGDAVVTDLPANTAELAKKYGLEWGGTWARPDAMHFEYVGNGEAGPASLGDVVVAKNAPRAQPAAVSGQPQPVPQAAPQVASTGSLFGDVVAPTAAPDFGSVVAAFLQNRQRRDEQEATEQARRNALFSQNPFG